MVSTNDKDLAALGKLFRTAREQIGLSQVKLAKKAGLSANYYAYVERGEKNISYKSLLKVLRALDIKTLDIR